MPCFELYLLSHYSTVKQISFRRANVTLANNSYVSGRGGGWGVANRAARSKRGSGGGVTGTSGEVQAERASCKLVGKSTYIKHETRGN